MEQEYGNKRWPRGTQGPPISESMRTLTLTWINPGFWGCTPLPLCLRANPYSNPGEGRRIPTNLDWSHNAYCSLCSSNNRSILFNPLYSRCAQPNRKYSSFIYNEVELRGGDRPALKSSSELENEREWYIKTSQWTGGNASSGNWKKYISLQPQAVHPAMSWSPVSRMSLEQCTCRGSRQIKSFAMAVLSSIKWTTK